MTTHRNQVLVLEDSSDRIDRFNKVLDQILPDSGFCVANTADDMIALISNRIAEAFVISLDHDLYVPGVADAGDGLQVAEHIATLQPICPVIIHTSNGERGRLMQGILEADKWEVRLAGAIGQDWIETDWITEVTEAYTRMNG